MSEPKAQQWAEKYRPQTFEDVVGNASAVSKARKIVEKGNVTSLLLHGPSGCAKTTLAFIIARGLTSVASDIEDINISDKRGIDDVRDLVKRTSFLPTGSCKVFILDEAHALLGQAQSAILKTLEQPKHSKVMFALCTNKPHLLSPELRGRLYKIEVERPEPEELADHLFDVALKEKAFPRFTDDQLSTICDEIVKATNSTPRDSMQLLQETADEEGEYKSFKALVIEGIRKQTDSTIDKTALQVLMAIYSRDASKKLADRANYLASQIYQKDAWGLMLRLVAINYDLMNHAAGVATSRSHYYVKELQPKDAVPDLQDAVTVGSRLAEIKNNLKNVDMSIEHYVAPELLRILFDLNH